MQTQFQNLSLDQLRYSIVWEDHETFNQSLDIGHNDEVLVITSAGDNVLNALLKCPKKVIAIDLNPIQNALLDFKRYIILNYPYEVYFAILGLKGSEAVKNAWSEISISVPSDFKKYWDAFFQKNLEGIMKAGKLESYLVNFISTLSIPLQVRLKEILNCQNIAEQMTLFHEKVNTPEFKNQFISYFNKANLSRARDPKLFKYVGEEVGETFYERLVEQSQVVLWKNNFHWRFFFFGTEGIDPSVLPPCYQEVNYSCLKENMFRLEILESEIVDFLLSERGKTISKASLSNVFEYASQEEFECVMEKLMEYNRQQSLQLIYWNLLQNQIYKSTNNHSDIKLTNEANEGCFYFKNAIQINITPKSIPQNGNAVLL